MHRRKKPKISSSDFWATSTDLPVNLQIPRNYCFWKTSCTSWYGSLSHCLQGFIHVGWCRISSNNNSSHSQSSSKVQWLKSRWHSPYILVYNYHQLPLTYFLVSVSSILNLRYVFLPPKEIPSLKLIAKALENWWLEDDPPFLLDLFRCNLSFREGRCFF